MRLENLRADDRADGRRISARVVWEGAHRGPEVLWFETDAAFAVDFEPAPEAFLVAALPLAVGLGEPRLRVEGRACARLRAGLEAAARLLASWYPTCREVPIEATDGFAALAPRPSPRAGAFLSGGVDSLAMLHRNRQAHPLDDAGRAPPEAIRDGIFLFGWNSGDFDGPVPRPERLRLHAAERARLERFAADAGCTLVTVRTNARTFHPTFAWSRDVAFGAGMVAPAHAFRRRLTEVSLASAGFPGVHPPHGSHPDLDPCWTSASLAVRHGDGDRTRLAKLRAIATWPAAMEALDVCLHHDVRPAGEANCGTCEKCLRTRLALAAVGALSRAPTFPSGTLTADEVRRMPLGAGFSVVFVDELAGPLVAAGRPDLAAALHEAVARAVRRAARRRTPWRRFLRRVRRWGGDPGAWTR